MAITITKPTVGGSSGTWGTELNTALDTIVAGVNAAQTAADTGGAGIPATTVTSRGDLIVATGSGTVTRQAVGNSGYTLTADSNQPTGVSWKLPPGSLFAKLRQTSNQSLTSGSYTNLTYQVADMDRAGAFSFGSGSYTPGMAGWYELAGGVSFNGVTGGYRALQWAVSGTAVPGGIVSVGNNNGAIYDAFGAKTVCVQLGSSDSVSLQAWQSTGSALTTFNTSPHGAFMTIKWLGA